METALGFFNVDKPLGMTSHDVVARIRRGLKLKKVGHAGTLDPLASGVLVICVGHAARLSDFVMHTTKRYRAIVHLGITTETYDAEGEPIQTRDTTHITPSIVQQVLQSFIGEIQQIPPMYSAIKQGGKKLYDLARAGETVEREPRHVRIDSLEVINWSLPQFTLDVTCSSGTYIRSLAYDIGEKLGVGAHLAGLTRLASGAFKLEQSLALETLLVAEDWKRYLISPQAALPDWPVLVLDEIENNHMLHGRSFPITEAVVGERVFAVAPDSNLTGVLEAHAGLWRPLKVFS